MADSASSARRGGRAAQGEWWRDAVVYQVYPRSFRDSDGDGVGDLPGALLAVDYLAGLGVDAVWLSPFFRSPQCDFGYDIADYCDVDPVFGTLADVDRLIAACHERGVRLIIDMVPNHCSSSHPAFLAALAAGPGSPEREMFHFRDGRGAEGDQPPNNWVGSDHGSCWTRITEADGQPGQWYLHLFGIDQPDWNWENPAVADMLDDVLRFWLRRGVDGIRVDVSHGMVKAAGLPDFTPGPPSRVIPTVDPATRPPMWDQDGVHAIIRRWRTVVEEFGSDRILVAEAWLDPRRAQLYVRPDEMHQSFNFHYLVTPWNAEALRLTIDTSLESDAQVGAPTTWVLSNHDVVRHATRYGYPPEVELPYGIDATYAPADRALGLRRARAATLLQLALPGSAYLYQGEELGLPEVVEIPAEARRDYVFFETADVGRDGCRVPLPWQASAPAFGFSPTGRAWLPQPAYFGDYAVDRQSSDPGSTLSLYRTALRLRAERGLGSGVVEWRVAPPGVLIMRRGATLVMVNTRSDPASVPTTGGWQVLVTSSSQVEISAGEVSLPGDTAVWLGEVGE